MRLFFGVPIDESVRKRVAAVQDRLRPVAGKVKWVEPANLHLTLRFVGEVPDAEVESVGRAAQGLAEAHLPVRLALRGVGAFPDPRRARVVWVGVSEGADVLARISRELSARVEAAIGLPPEPRGFAPHLTVGRMKVPARNEALAGLIGELQGEACGEFAADHFALYHSTLTPRGPVYRVVGTYGGGGVTAPPTPDPGGQS